MPNFNMMIGLPASGKTTIANKLMRHEIISTDNMIEKYAENVGKTYNEVFSEVIKEFELLFFKRIEYAVQESKDFTVDRTNLSVKSRKRILQMIPEFYYKTAYVVHCDDLYEHNRRLNSRPGKTIPPAIMKSMRDNFVYPSLEEGFDEILNFPKKGYDIE